MPLKWIPRSKSGALKSRPRWAAHTRIANVWEYPPPGVSMGLLHDDVILLQLPESFRLLFSCEN